MAGTYDAQIRTTSVAASKEIKASANYGYITNGITLDGSKFATGALVVEGQCLVRNDATGKYEPYTETTEGTFEPGFSNPVVLDQSIKFVPKDDGTNPDIICGQVLVWGAVWKGQLIGVTDTFIVACPQIRFVTA